MTQRIRINVNLYGLSGDNIALINQIVTKSVPNGILLVQQNENYCIFGGVFDLNTDIHNKYKQFSFDVQSSIIDMVYVDEVELSTYEHDIIYNH